MTEIPTPPPGSGKESSMVKILTGILEDSVQALRRIEKQVVQQNKIINNLISRVNNIENKFDSNIDNLVKTSLPSFEASISQKMETLETTTFDELNELLKNLVYKLKQNLQLITIQEVVENIDELSAKIKGKKPKSEGKKETTAKKESKPQNIESKETKPTETAPTPKPAQDEPELIEEEEDEDHLVRPSSFFGS